MSEEQEHVVTDEGAAIAGGETSSKRVDPGFKRNVMVIGLVVLGAAIVMAVIVMMMRSGSKAIVETKSNISIQEGSPIKSNDGLTPAMREKLARAQERESNEAGAKGQSYIPPDILPEKAEPVAQQPAQHYQDHAQPVATDPSKDKRNQVRLAAAEQMLGSMLARPVAQRVAVAKIDPPAVHASAPASAASGPADEEIVVDIMEIFGARLSSPIDTDKSGFASAEITTGRLAGALLIGSVKLVNEGIEFKFTGMRHDKKTYPINAIALDAKTSTSAVQGELDRKLLTRYVFPVLMAYTGAYATARSQVATTTTAMGYGGDYGVARPAPTEQQARAAGVAAAVGIGNQAVGQGAREPVRVTMNTGESIGVMFREVVLASRGASARNH